MKTRNRKNSLTIKDDCVFDLVIFAAFVLIAIESFKYNPLARSIPLGLGIVGGVMMFLQLLADALPSAKSKMRFVGQRGLFGSSNKSGRLKAEGGVEGVSEGVPSESQKQGEKSTSWFKVFRIALWLLIFAILLKFINYLVAVGIFILFLTKVEAEESWFRAGSVTLITCVTFYILFELILNLHF